MKAHERSYQLCNHHVNKTIKYVCMDPECKENTLSCELCVVKLHNKCKDEHLINKTEIEFKLQVYNPAKYNTKVHKIINDIFDRQIINFNNELRKAKKSILESYRSKIYAGGKQFNFATINKEDYMITIDPDTQKINIKSKKDNIARTSINDNIETILNGENHKLEKALNEIYLLSATEIKLKQWLVSPKASLDFEREVYTYKLKNFPSSVIENYCILNKVLSPGVIKFGVHSSYDKLAKIRIGLIDLDGLEKSKEMKKINAFDQPVIDCYKYLNLSNEKNDKNSIDQLFTTNNNIIMSLRANEVSFKSTDCPGTFSATLNAETEYYLFVSILEKDNWCDIQFIE